jgi:hypothetical protein
MPTHQAIVTASAGPGRVSAAAPIVNMTDMHINFNDKRIQFFYDFGANFRSEFELATNASITITNNNGNFTVTIT